MNTTAEKTKPIIPTEPLIEDAGISAQLVPFVGAGALVLAAAAVRFAATVSSHEAEVAAGTAATAIVVAVVAAFATRRRFVNRKSRHAFFGWLLLATGWLSWTVANGFGATANATLAIVGTGLSLGWWRMHKIPNEPGLRGEPIEPGLDKYESLWASHLGGQSDAFQGSRLANPEPTRAGIRYTLHLKPGKQSISKVLAEYENVRGGLRLTDDIDLIIEKHPTLGAPTGRVTIVTRSPIRKDLPWMGPDAFDPATGLINLGPFSDGEGFATWRLFTKDSMWGGFICGGTGSGKSRTIESICMAATAAGVTVWFLDGQNGGSSKLLRKKADQFAGEYATWKAALEQAIEILQIRQDENDVLDVDGFTHTRQRPGLMIVIDECHKIFAFPELAAMADTIAREGRKVGVVILAASQVNDLKALGNLESLRSSLLMGNGILMRTKSNSAKGLFDVDVDPRHFPQIPGYGFRVDPMDRSAPYRGWFVNDEAAEKWADFITWATLDPVAAGAAGPDYTERHMRAAAAKAERKARVEAARNGTLHTHLTRTVPAVPTMPASDFTVLSFPTWDPTQLKPPTGISTGHRAVAAALAEGRGMVAGQHYCKPSTMAAEVNLSERRVHTILKDLVAQDIVRAGDTQGRYYPTGKVLAEQAA